MKPWLLGITIVFCGAALRAEEKDAAFAPAPMQLEVPFALLQAHLDQSFSVVVSPAALARMGPGIPLKVNSAPMHTFPLLDAPGPGYRQQKAEIVKP